MSDVSFPPGSQSSTADSLEALVGQIAEEFLQQTQRGEQPDVEEYARRYPAIAPVLRQVLAALQLVQAPAGDLAVDDSAPFAGQVTGCLGDYRIVQEIGRGGMGVVYEAEQISLGRRVALKVLPFAAALDPKPLQRFKNEAHAAAQLHHTNIVPVFGVGCERGVHYYAMQFIDGQTLAALIRELRQISGLETDGPSRLSPSLSAAAQDLLSERDAPVQRPAAEGPPTGPYVPAPDTAALPSTATTPRRATAVSTEHSIKSAAYFRTVARLGRQAAEALEHAHQLGVVHRDIKPANLLLDVRGNLWVTDFGLAHCQSQVGLTMLGDLVGTLRYMSPEQALAKRVLIDHRTDIYSLGVTLYELLTLQHAFAGRDREEVLRQITFEEPRPPRRLNKAVPVELETIVLKAMEKIPGARYATAQELADDLQRFLEDKPIKAKRPTLARLVQKWARRHRPFVAAAAVVCLMALLFAAGTWLWMVQTSAQTVGAAQEALQRAGDLQANGRWSEALDAAQHAESLLQLAVGRPDLRQRAQAMVSDMNMLRRLEEIRLEQTGLKDDHFDSSPADSSYAVAFREYGIDVDNLEVAEAGERIRARPIYLKLSAALDDWALVRLRTRRRTGAKTNWKQLLAVARAADPDAWRNRFREAVEGSSGDRKILEDLVASADIDSLPAPTLHLLGRSLWVAGAGDTAAKVLRQAQQRFPDDFMINIMLGQCYVGMKPPELGESLRFSTTAVAIDPQNPGAHYNLGLALKELGQVSEAVAEFRKATLLKSNFTAAQIQLAFTLQKLGKSAEAVAEWRKAIRLKPDSAEAHYNLGIALNGMGARDEAIAAYKEAIRLQPDHARAQTNLGGLLCDYKHDYAGALAAVREAIRLQPDLVEAHNNLGLILNHQRDYPAAIAAFREAIRLKPDNAAAHGALGHALVRLKKYAEAVAACREAVRFNPQSPPMHHDLALALCALGKFGEALTEFRQATLLKPDFPVSHYFVGICLQKLGKPAEAVAEFREAIRLKPDETGAHGDLAQTFAMMGRSDEARAEYQEAIRLRRAALARSAQPERSHAASEAAKQLQEELAEDHCNLAKVLYSQDKIGEAENELRDAIRIRPEYARAHNSLGALLCDKKHDYEGAIAAFKTAIQLAPNEGVHYMNLGNAFREKGAWDEAIAAYQQAIRLKPDEAKIRWQLALALEKKGALDEAIAALRETIRLKQDWPRVHNSLGNLLLRKGQPGAAEAEYREAIRLQPNDAMAYIHLGALLCDNKRDYPGAIAAFREALRLQPDWSVAHVLLGTALGWQGKLREAEAEYREALRLQPDRPEPHYQLGIALGRQGKLGQAEAEYREAIRLKPDYADAYLNLGALLCDQKHDYEGAIAAFREALRLKPDSPLAHRNLGTALSGQGKLDEAEAEYWEAIRLKPDWAEAHVNLGNALGAQKHWPAALAELRKAIDLQPDFAPAYNQYAWLLATCPQSGLRNPSQAVASAKKATELAPKVGGYWNTLGVAQYRVGAWQAATTALERSMVLQKGGDAFDWLFLAMAQWKLGHQEDAHQWYHQALSWMDKNKSPNEELSRFRAEARALFELQGPEAPKEIETSPRKR